MDRITATEWAKQRTSPWAGHFDEEAERTGFSVETRRWAEEHGKPLEGMDVFEKTVFLMKAPAPGWREAKTPIKARCPIISLGARTFWIVAPSGEKHELPIVQYVPKAKRR